MMILESTMVQKTSTRKRETIKTLVDEDKKGERIPPHEGTKGAMESLQ